MKHDTLKEKVLQLGMQIRSNAGNKDGLFFPINKSFEICEVKLLEDIERMVQDHCAVEDRLVSANAQISEATDELNAANRQIVVLQKKLAQSYAIFAKQGEMFDRVLAVNQTLIKQSKPVTTLRFFNGRLQQQVNQEWVDVLHEVPTVTQPKMALTQDPKCSIEGCNERRYGGIGGGLLCFHHMCKRGALFTTLAGTTEPPINDRTCSVQGCMRLRMNGGSFCADHLDYYERKAVV